jgi:hypothetical protein
VERELGIPARLEEKGANGGCFPLNPSAIFYPLSLSSIAALTRHFSSVQDPLLELDGSSPEPPLFRNDAELPAMTRHRSDKGRDHRDSFTTPPLIRVAANLSDEP